MEQLPRLRARISAFGDFHELIRALEALAATHYRAAQEALRVSTKHLKIVNQSIRSISPTDRVATAGAPVLRAQTGVVIAVGSEHGFVGAFNERVLDRLEAERRPGEDVILVGRRAVQTAMDRSIIPERDLSMAAHVQSVPGLARRLSIGISWARSIRIIFSRHRTDTRRSIDCKVIDFGSNGSERSANSLDQPLHHLTLGQLQESLRHDFVFATIAHCLLESLASENATRLASMQAADRNVRDKLAQLGQRERTVRQQEITEELLDILTGVESVSS